MADSPPDWRTSFHVPSANLQYNAEVTPRKKGKAGEPWNWSYQVAVYSAKPHHKELWRSEYFHSGYSGGLLSDDGNYFVYLEFWYRSDSTLIAVYSKSENKSIMAKDLGILGLEFPKTVSHQLWLKNISDTRFLIENGHTVGIQVNTIHGQRSVRF